MANDLREGVKLPQVVDSAQHDDDDRTTNNRVHFRGDGLKTAGEGGQLVGQEHCPNEPGKHGYPTHAGLRDSVDVTVADFGHPI